MPLRDDLLNPIPGENPSGADIRYDTKLLIFDKIKEARREDDALAQGDWQRDRKVADYKLASKLAQEALGTQTKDLQLAAWLADAMLRTEGFGGFNQGLKLCSGLVANFWDTLYPPIEDGDMDLRIGPLDWLSTATEMPLKSSPLTKDGHNWYQYKDSRALGYEEQLKNDKERKARDAKIAEGKLAPEVFDKAFVETPKAFYLQGEKDLDACLATVKELDKVCDEKFGSGGPSFGKLKTSLEEVRHTVHALLEKKRETEPDPIEVAAPDAAAQEGGVVSAGGVVAASVPGITLSVLSGSDPPDRREAIAAVAKAAALLRKNDPHSPAPYLMMRGLRWGELRAAPGLTEPRLLEAPSTELRQHVKRLALAKKWAELLETAETAMSLPCSRAWLDLQRLVVAACTGLGEEYEPVAAAIRSEVRTLLNDIPQLWNATLLDDTAAANSETKAWLEDLGGAPIVAAEPPKEGESGAAAVPAANGHNPPSWLPKTTEAYALAKEALTAGQPERAFDIMRKEIVRQKSGRGRFERTMQLVELCVAAKKEAIAQPLLDDLAAQIEAHKLDDWEDKEMVAAALATLMRYSQKIKDSSSDKKKLFERICRLDPVRALTTE